MTLINLTQDTTGKMNKLSGTVTGGKVLVSTASDPDNISESSSTVGGATQPIYLNAGTLTAGTALSSVATSGSYTDLSDKPTIPTVNDATLTIQKNGVAVGTFTANASSNATANITVPTTASDVGALASDTVFATINGTSVKSNTAFTFPSFTATNEYIMES